MLVSAVTVEDTLAREKIEFIPSDEFESASEQDFAEIEGDLYADDEPGDRSATSAESFLLAVEQSRLLSVEGERFLFKRLNFLRFRASALQATATGKRMARKTKKEIERLLSEANETREQIACANLRLVTSIVRRLARTADEFDEFLAEGNAILLKAIDKFDYSRGFRFSTYATHAVQRHTFRLIERINKRKQREAANSELLHSAQAVESDKPDGREVLAAVEQITGSFDDTLTPREQHIIRSRFGLDGSEKGKTLKVIGEEVGLSKERVRQIVEEGLRKLAENSKQLESLFDRF
jgi:RNA polymerase sigma factor (sigma-70 family)